MFSGTFSSSIGVSECLQCDVNQYSPNPGASECLTCPSGRYTNGIRGAETCRTCDVMYIGSSTCSVPVLGIIIGLVSVLVVLIVAFLVRRRFEHDRKAKEKLRVELIRQRALVKVKCTDIALLGSAWKLTEDQIQLKECVGRGVHGTVYRGALGGKWEVAVKIMSSSDSSRQKRSGSESLESEMGSPSYDDGKMRNAKKTPSYSSLSGSVDNRTSMSGSGTNRLSHQYSRNGGSLFDNSEVRFLMRTRHERLCMFLGVGMMGLSGKDREFFLVTEWMNGGNLSEFYWNKPMVAWTQRLQILSDVLEGLAYLHLLHKSVHCDLKSANIMLDKPFNSASNIIRAKICDFGLSKIFTCGKRRIRGKGTSMSSIQAISAASWKVKSRGFVGTPRWMAPELMEAETAHVSPSVDIYSFGIVMWETWCQQKPLNSFHESSDIFHAVKKGIRPILPSNLVVPDGYKELMKQCWSQNPTDRPLIDVVMGSFEILRRNYIKDLIDKDKIQSSLPDVLSVMIEDGSSKNLTLLDAPASMNQVEAKAPIMIEMKTGNQERKDQGDFVPPKYSPHTPLRMK